VSRFHTLVDTGPIVAYLVKSDRYHRWACDILRTRPSPLHTCEAVLTEAFHLLSGTTGGSDGLSELLRQGHVRVGLHFDDEVERILVLMAKYADVPMSFADACLVRMTELHEQAAVLTLDRDFRLYRRNGRGVIKALLPRR
jgi:uncharacterized protein